MWEETGVAGENPHKQRGEHANSTQLLTVISSYSYISYIFEERFMCKERYCRAFRQRGVDNEGQRAEGLLFLFFFTGTGEGEGLKVVVVMVGGPDYAENHFQRKCVLMLTGFLWRLLC